MCLSVCSQETGTHVTITHDALDLNIQTPLVFLTLDTGTPPQHQTWDNLTLVPPLLVLASGGQSTYVWQAGSTHPTRMPLVTF